MRDLAAAVGMRAPSLYQYFDSKLAIYDAMFGQGMVEALAVVEGGIEGREGREALRESGRGAPALHRQGSGPQPAAVPAHDPGLRTHARLLCAGGRHERTGGVPDRGARGRPMPAAAMDLWTALIGGLSSQQLANEPGGERWIRLFDRAVDMFFAAVDRPPRPKEKRGS